MQLLQRRRGSPQRWCLNRGVLLVSLLNGLPALQLINALLGQSDGALAVVYANNNSLDLVANVDVGSYVVVRVVRQLTQRDIRSVLKRPDLPVRRY